MIYNFIIFDKITTYTLYIQKILLKSRKFIHFLVYIFLIQLFFVPLQKIRMYHEKIFLISSPFAAMYQ